MTKRKKKQLAQEQGREDYEILKLLKEFQPCNVSNVEEIEEKLKELQKVNSNTPEVKKEIRKTRRKLVEKKKYLLEQEQKENNEQEQIEAKQQKINDIKQKIINELVKTRSLLEIPSYATTLEDGELSDCVEEAKRKILSIKHLEIVKLQAKEWFFEHKGFPAEYPRMNDKEQEIYKLVHREREQGTILTKEDIKKEDKELYGTPVIETKKLSAEQRKRFEKRYGYEYVPFTRFDGKGANNVIILKNNKQESNQHFIWKHLFAKEFEGTTEKNLYEIKADIYLPEPDIVIEIETGKNRISEINKKIDILEKMREETIIICPRKEKSTYQKYAEKTKVMTPKQAHEYLTNTLNH